MCNDRITKEYKGIDEGQQARSEVNTRISSDEVILRIIGEEGWNIRFDKEPTKVNSCSYALFRTQNFACSLSQILKDDIHLPELLDFEVSDFHDYPPKILIYVQPTGIASVPPKLEIIGLDRECYFELPAPSKSPLAM